LTKLQDLTVPASGVTDTGLKYLHGMTKMKNLVFAGTTNATAQGIADLKKALPNAKIHAEPR
jgi:hypothetical protein